jgi:Domain of unknown function (DUF4864)
MKRIAGLFVALFLAAGFAATGPAKAQNLGDGDRATIQSLITGQIEAFKRDDGATAYGFASPTIHSFFPTVEGFMAMVMTGYPPVYRPQSVIFGQLVLSDTGPLQQVFITGPDGNHYVAIYSMERQPDGTWKINGCSLVKDDSPSI